MRFRNISTDPPQKGRKQVECLKCGWAGFVSDKWPIKDAWCGQCHASGNHLRKLTEKISAPKEDVNGDS